MSKNEQLVKLGECRKPHGIKGGFKFHLYNQEDSVLKNKETITLFPLSSASSIPSEGKEFEIKTIHFGNQTVCYLNDIVDRNIVEAMLPFSIHYPREKFPKLEDGQWYVSDLEGLKVLDTLGREVGKISRYFDNGAQLVLTVVTENEKFELPFIEAFFPEIDIEAGTITFITPEYDE